MAVVLNGEIYNFRELRERLRGRGHRFATEGDTEVIVHLYEEHGIDMRPRACTGCSPSPCGTAPRRRLLLARDRVGKKPLFYACGRRRHSLRLGVARRCIEDDPVPREMDPRALDCLPRVRVRPGAASRSSAGPQAAAGAHTGSRSGAGRASSATGAWTTPASCSVERPARAARADPRAICARATERRMIADVPMGAFLSGGIDSSAVVAAMAEASSSPVKTFSIGFDSDALQRAGPRATDRRNCSEQTTRIHRPRRCDRDRCHEIVRHYGEPFADASAIPSFYLAELTRRSVTVALNGDGGDETFGGLHALRVQSAGGANGTSARARVRRAAARGGGRLEGGDVASVRNKARRLLQGLALEPPERYAHYVSWIGTADAR